MKRSIHHDLDDQARELIAQRTDLWEVRLVAHLLEIWLAPARSFYSRKMNDARPDPELDFLATLLFAHARILDLNDWMQQLEKLINCRLPSALGRPGTPCKPDVLVAVCRRLAEQAWRLVQWERKIAKATPHPSLASMFAQLRGSTQEFFTQLKQLRLDFKAIPQRRRQGETNFAIRVQLQTPAQLRAARKELDAIPAKTLLAARCERRGSTFSSGGTGMLGSRLIERFLKSDK